MEALREEVRDAVERYRKGQPVPGALRALAAVSCIVQADGVTEDDLGLLDLLWYALDGVYSGRPIAPREPRGERLAAVSGAPPWGSAPGRGDGLSTREERWAVMSRVFEALSLLVGRKSVALLRLASLATFCRALKASPRWIVGEIWEVCAPYAHEFVISALSPEERLCKLGEGVDVQEISLDTVLGAIRQHFGTERQLEVIAAALHRLAAEILGCDEDARFRELWRKQRAYSVGAERDEYPMWQAFQTQALDLQATVRVEQPEEGKRATLQERYESRARAFTELFLTWLTIVRANDGGNATAISRGGRVESVSGEGRALIRRASGERGTSVRGASFHEQQGQDAPRMDDLNIDASSPVIWAILIAALRVSARRKDEHLARAASDAIASCVSQRDKCSRRLEKLSFRAAEELTVFQAAGEEDGEVIFLGVTGGSKTRISYPSVENVCALCRNHIYAFFACLASLSVMQGLAVPPDASAAPRSLEGINDSQSSESLSACAISLSSAVVSIMNAFHRLSATLFGACDDQPSEAGLLAAGAASAVTSTVAAGTAPRLAAEIHATLEFPAFPEFGVSPGFAAPGGSVAQFLQPSVSPDLRAFASLADSCFSLLREDVCDGAEFACGAESLSPRMVEHLLSLESGDEIHGSLLLWAPVHVFERFLRLYRGQTGNVCSQAMCSLKFVFLHLVSSPRLRLAALELLSALLRGRWALDTSIPRFLVFLQIYGSVVDWPLLRAVLSGDLEGRKKEGRASLGALAGELFAPDAGVHAPLSAAAEGAPSYEWISEYLKREDFVSSQAFAAAEAAAERFDHVLGTAGPRKAGQKIASQLYSGSVAFALFLARYVSVSSCDFVDRVPLHGIPTALRRAVKRFYRGRLEAFSLSVYLRLGFFLLHSSPQEIWSREFSFYTLKPPQRADGDISEFDLQNLCTSSLIPLLSDLQDRESDSCVMAATLFGLDLGEGIGADWGREVGESTEALHDGHPDRPRSGGKDYFGVSEFPGRLASTTSRRLAHGEPRDEAESSQSFSSLLQGVYRYSFPMYSAIELGGERSRQVLASRREERLKTGYLCGSLRDQVFAFLGGCSLQLFTDSCLRLIPQLFVSSGALQQTGTMVGGDALAHQEEHFTEQPDAPFGWADLVLLVGQIISALGSPYAHIRFSAVALLHALSRSPFVVENVLKRYFYAPFDSVLELPPDEADGMSVLRSQLLQAAICTASAVPLLSVLWKLSEKTVRVPSTVLNQALRGLESAERLDEQRDWAAGLGRNTGLLFLTSRERRFLDSVAADLTLTLQGKSATPEAPAAMSQALFEAIFSPAISLCIAGTAVDTPLPEGLGRALLSVLRRDPEMLAMAVRRLSAVIDDLKCAGVSATALRLQERAPAIAGRSSLYLVGYEQKVAGGRAGMASLFFSESISKDVSELIGASLMDGGENLGLPLPESVPDGTIDQHQARFHDESFLLFSLHYLLDRIRSFTAATTIDQMAYASLSELFCTLTSLVSLVQVPTGAADLIVTSTLFSEVQLFEKEAYCSLVLARLEFLRKISQKYSLTEGVCGEDEAGFKSEPSPDADDAGDMKPEDLKSPGGEFNSEVLAAKATIDSEISRVWFATVGLVQELYSARKIQAATLREFVRFIAGFNGSDGEFCIRVAHALCSLGGLMGQADGLQIYLSFIDSTLDLSLVRDLALWLLNEEEDQRCELALVSMLFVGLLHDAEKYQNAETLLHELFGSTNCDILFLVLNWIFEARGKRSADASAQQEAEGAIDVPDGLEDPGISSIFAPRPASTCLTATYRLIGTFRLAQNSSQRPAPGDLQDFSSVPANKGEELRPMYADILRFLRESILERIGSYSKAFSHFITRGNMTGAIGSTRAQLLDRALTEGSALAFALLIEGTAVHFDASQKAELAEIVRGLSASPERALACLRLLEAVEGATPDIHTLLAITCRESIFAVVKNAILAGGGRGTQTRGGSNGWSDEVALTDSLQTECYPINLRREDLARALAYTDTLGPGSSPGGASEAPFGPGVGLNAKPDNGPVRSAARPASEDSPGSLHNCDIESVVYPYPVARRAQILPYSRMFVDSLLEQGRVDIVQEFVDSLSACCAGQSVSDICLVCDVLIDTALAVLSSGTGRIIEYNVQDILVAAGEAVARSRGAGEFPGYPSALAARTGPEDFVPPEGDWKSDEFVFLKSVPSTARSRHDLALSGAPMQGSGAAGHAVGAGHTARIGAVWSADARRFWESAQPGLAADAEADDFLGPRVNRMLSPKTQAVMYLSQTSPHLLRRILWLDSLGRTPLAATLGSLQVSYSRQTLRDFRASTELYRALKSYVCGAVLPLLYRSAVVSVIARERDEGAGEAVRASDAARISEAAGIGSDLHLNAKGAAGISATANVSPGGPFGRLEAQILRGSSSQLETPSRILSRISATLDVMLSQILRLTSRLVCHQYLSFLGDQFYHTDSREAELRSARLLCQPALASLLMLRCFSSVPVREEVLAGLAGLLGMLSLEEQLELDVLANLIPALPELFSQGGSGPLSLDASVLAGRMALDVVSGELVELSPLLSSPERPEGLPNLTTIRKIYGNTLGVMYRLP